MYEIIVISQPPPPGIVGPFYILDNISPVIGSLPPADRQAQCRLLAWFNFGQLPEADFICH